jgi:hypothetical protein
MDNYKRYVVCPQCKNEIVASGLSVHFRRVHRKNLSSEEMIEILAKLTWERTRKPKRVKNLKADQEKLKPWNQKTPPVKKPQRTPLSMLSWFGDDTPRKYGPIGPEAR